MEGAQDPPQTGAVRVIPLGGVGEFGKNAIVLEYGNDLLLLDCGQMFPETHMFGVDTVIPDFDYVLRNRDRLRAIVLTHGHEDHIGALAYLLRQLGSRLETPVLGSPLAIELVRSKLRELNVEGNGRLHSVEAGARHVLGAIDVQFLAVAHSMPQAMALVIRLPEGLVVHTGDYKLEATGHEEADLLSLAPRLGRESIMLLLADSTNIDREGRAPSEDLVREGLGQVMAEADRTIIMATFSSNLHRVQSVIDLAQALGRQVAICGFSLERNFEIATRMGLIQRHHDVVCPLGHVVRLPPHERCIVTTGTQGEPLSALSRLSLNNFKGYRIQPGDLVVLSSRIIPGNEKSIYNMINHFYRHGARVVTENDAMVHGSGHAYRDEMAWLIQQLQPHYFMPIHGELRQLIRHRELAIALGLEPQRCFVVENGGQLELEPRQARTLPTAWAGQVLVDGKVMGHVDEIILRDRRHLSADGMITVILVIDQKSHSIIAGPDIVSRGFVVVDDNTDLIEDCKRVVVEAFEACDTESQEEWEVVKLAVRKALRKFLRQQTDRYPVILPVVVEI